MEQVVRFFTAWTIGENLLVGFYDGWVILRLSSWKVFVSFVETSGSAFDLFVGVEVDWLTAAVYTTAWAGHDS